MRTQREPLRDRARGRWVGILPQLGVGASSLDGRHGPCPMCGGRDRFRFDDKDGEGTWICSKCGAGDGVRLVMMANGIEFAEAAPRIEELIGSVEPAPIKVGLSEEDRKNALNRLWRLSSAIRADDAAGRWLAARVGLQGGYPEDLRFVSRMRYSDPRADRSSEHPGMIAMVRQSDGTPVTLHRTYLAPSGRKADVSEPRKLMAGKTPKGVSIQLAQPGSILGVAEGIETALAAAAIFGVPVWAAINSSMLEAWQPPAGVSEVIVFGDHDPKFGGQAAAFALAHRLACDDRLGVTARVEMPARAGDDWNDVLLNDLRRAG